MQANPENPPQKPTSSAWNKNLPLVSLSPSPSALARARALPTGHLFGISIAGVLLGGLVDLSLALLNKRQKGKTSQQIG